MADNRVRFFMQAVSFPIYWPTREAGSRFLQGRLCMDYERLSIKVVDPDLPAWKRERGNDEPDPVKDQVPIVDVAQR